jgi:hypothetical protein
MAAKKKTAPNAAKRAAKARKPAKPRVVGGGGDDDPRTTLIIVDELGVPYKLTAGKWRTDDNKLGDEGSPGVVNQMVAFGSLVAYTPDISTGAGTLCTVVNLKAILKGAGT